MFRSDELTGVKVLINGSAQKTIPWDRKPSQDEIARIRKQKRGRNMLNRSGNTTDNLCFRYRFRDVFSCFRCCVYNGTGPLFVHVKHNGNMELHVSATFQKYGNMWFRPVPDLWIKVEFLKQNYIHMITELFSSSDLWCYSWWLNKYSSSA